MTLGETRRAFGKCLMRLEIEMDRRGFEWQRGECVRTDEQAVINSLGDVGRQNIANLVAEASPALAIALTNNGKVKSPLMTVHRLGLGQDYDLFRDGVYLAGTEDHRELGRWWEEQHPLARWGGRFGDGNHYSFEWNGVK